jgi:hypothetical protein
MSRFRIAPTRTAATTAIRWCGWLVVLAVCGCSRSRIELNPAVMPGCALGHGQVVTVSWDASRTGAKQVSVLVRRPGGGHERPWVRGAVKGQRRTGRWVTDGLTFVMRDQRGKILALKTVETARCPLKQKDE